MIYKLFTFLIRPLVGSGIGRITLFSGLYQKIMLLILPKAERIVEVQGFKIKILTDGHISDIATELLFKGIHEPITTHLFRELINPGDCVVDVGANVGYFTLLASKLVGNRGMVLAFEPDHKNVKLLNDNIKLNKFDNIQTFEVALSNKGGRAVLFTSSKESARHSLIHTKEHDGDYLVNTERLDVLVDKATKVDFLKTDTEGHELAVLQGAEKTILNNPDIKVLLEVYEDAMAACDVKVETLWLYLIGKLDFSYIYFVDDYSGRIIEIFSPSIYKMDWQELGSKSGKNKLACNLLCSRKPIDAC
jgi:FkbM family methyltransferase